jgi:hypothetical protein
MDGTTGANRLGGKHRVDTFILITNTVENIAQDLLNPGIPFIKLHIGDAEFRFKMVQFGYHTAFQLIDRLIKLLASLLCQLE